MSAAGKKTEMCSCPLRLKSMIRLVRGQTLVQLYVELIMVARSIKPAWLCDLLCTEPSEIDKVIQILETENLLQQGKLRTVNISGDNLVVNLETFNNRLNSIISSLDYPKCNSDTPIFVMLTDNITANKLNKSLKQKLRNSLQTIIDGIDKYFIDHDKTSLHFELGCMTPSIFGIALGYPVVYVQPNSNNDGQFVPETMDLHLVQIKIKTHNLLDCKYKGHKESFLEHIIYSFSVPKKVECCLHLNNWEKHFKEQCEKLGVEIDIDHIDVENTHVIL